MYFFGNSNILLGFQHQMTFRLEFNSGFPLMMEKIMSKIHILMFIQFVFRF